MKDRVLKHLVTDGDMSGDVTSPWFNIQGLDATGFQLIWTGTPAGAFYVDISNDGGTTASVLSLDLSAIAPAGAGGNGAVDLFSLAFAMVRVRYVATSGAGALNVHVFARAL